MDPGPRRCGRTSLCHPTPPPSGPHGPCTSSKPAEPTASSTTHPRRASLPFPSPGEGTHPPSPPHGSTSLQTPPPP